MGARYDCKDNMFKVTTEGLLEDIDKQAEGETTLSRMGRILLPAMNQINPDVQFTVETSEDFQSGWLPTLDLDLYMGVGGIISHTSYQKPMRTPILIMAKSAMSSQMKNNTLANEEMRRVSPLHLFICNCA